MKTLFLLLFAAITSQTPEAFGQTGDAESSTEPPKSATFFLSTRPPMDTWVWNVDHRYTSFRIGEENGKEFGTLNVYEIRRINQDVRETYAVRYGKLHEGDIVPMLTAVYRVVEVDPEEKQFTVNRIDDPKLLKDIGVIPESYPIPLNCGVKLQDIGLAALDFAVNNSGEATARIIASYSVPIKPMFSRGIKLDFPGLQAGKSIEVKDAKYKVRKIVPPDTDRQIRGWIELTPIRDGDGGAKDNRAQKN
jgi:hypothetical protein